MLTGRLLLALLLLSSETAGPAPAFPWQSFRAIAQEPMAGEVNLCNPENPRTRVTAFFIHRPMGFYRVWAMTHGREWMAVRYDGDARPEWVWRGTWAGDVLAVTSVSPYDRSAHASACEVLFGTI